MSYKIVRITNLYTEYLNQYREAFPHMKLLSYKEQYSHLIDNPVDAASSVSRYLRDLGIEAIDIYTNVTELQNRWSEERGFKLTGRELLFEQVKELQPEVIWVDHVSLVDSDWIKYVRENVKSIKIIIGYLCSPYSSLDLKSLQSCDFVIACTPCLVSEMQRIGIKAYLIYHGFDSNILNRVSDDNNYPVNDLLFTGSLFVGGGFHKTRIEYLERFLEEDIPVSIYGGVDSFSKIVLKKTAYHTINLLKMAGSEKWIRRIPYLNRYEGYGDTPIKFYSAQLKRSLHRPVYGIEQFKLLAKAKICFNIHGEIAKGCAGNLRLFEATGIGTCLITDWKKNLHDLFEPDSEVITYRSPDECIDKIKWLMNNPAEAKRIGMAGQARTLRDHSIEMRAKQINYLLLDKIK